MTSQPRPVAAGLVVRRLAAAGVVLAYGAVAVAGLGNDLATGGGVAYAETAINAVGLLPGLTVALAARRRDERGYTWAGVLTSAGYTLACLLWLLLPLPLDPRGFWLSSLAGVPGIALVLAGRPRSGAATVVLHCTLANLVLWRRGSTPSVTELVVNVVAALVLYLTYAIVAHLFVSQRSDIERAGQALAREYQQHVTREAQREVAARLDRFTHDEILSLLALAAAGFDAETLRPAAQRLDRALREGSHGPHPASAGQLRELLAAAVPAGPVTVAPLEGRDVALPGPVGDDLLAAALEAVRNALRHSGGAARVTVRGATGRVFVVVADDGGGFDVSATDGARFGMRHSMIEPVERHPGGRVEIDSAPGRGTRITLSADAAARGHGGGSHVAGLAAHVAQSIQTTAATQSVAVLVLVAYPILGTLVILTRWSQYRHPDWMWLAVALVVGVGLVSARFGIAPELRSDLALLGLCWSAGAIALWQAKVPMIGTLVLWPIGMAVMISAFYVIAGSVRIGWLLALVAVLPPGVVLLAAGQSTLAIRMLLMLVQPLIAALVRRNVDRARAGLQRDLQVYAADLEQETRNAVETEERAVVRQRVESAVGTVLARLRDGDDLDEELRERARLGELHLRDWIRARGLMTERLAQRVLEARRRGVRVRLLDDRGTALEGRARALAAAWVEDQLRQARSGDFVTVRLMPLGRSHALTLVSARGDESTRAELTEEQLAR